jgi:hypothetical protein
MRKNYRTIAHVGLLSASLFLTYGCVNTPPGAPPSTAPPPKATGNAPPPPPAPVVQQPPAPPARRAGELALADGVDLYNQGNYAGAIKKLQESSEIWTEAPLIRVEALKHMAFSACLNKQRTPCRQYFDRLLEIDPGFELTPAETGQPDWTPIFRQAKQALSTPARKPVNPAR